MDRSRWLSALLALGFSVSAATQLPPGFSVNFPSPLRSLKAAPPTVTDMVAAWRGLAQGCEISLVVHFFDARQWLIHEPEDVIELLRVGLRAPVGPGLCNQSRIAPPSLRAGSIDRAWTRLERVQTWTGPYGSSPLAGFTRGTLFRWGGDEPIGTFYAMGGVLDEKAYLIKVSCYPKPSPMLHEALVALLKRGVRYNGFLRDPRWSDKELHDRWRKWAPKTAELRRILRTENYAIMTSSSAGPSYGRRLEETYRAFRKLVPFRKVPGRRRLLVFLFRDRNEYEEFAQYKGAHNTCGHAAWDYFSTWYGSPDEQVHTHEVVHQLMSHRAFLGGGGAWFQEGLADYLAAPRWQRARTARVVRHRGISTNLRVLLSEKRFEPPREPGELGPHPHCALSALWFEFLAESDWGRTAFPRILESLGVLKPGDWCETEAAMVRATGVDFNELETRWLDYCAKR